MTTPRQVGDSGARINSGVSANVLSANTVIGNTVVVFIGAQSNTTGIVSAVTSPIGTFTRITDTSNPSAVPDLEVWACLAATGNAKAITVTTTGGVQWVAQATEWPLAAVSVVAGPNGSASASPASLTLSGLASYGQTTVMVGTRTTNVPTSGPPSPWTGYNTGGWTLSLGLGVAYQTPSVSSVTANWTLPSAGPWITASVIVTFPGPTSSMQLPALQVQVAFEGEILSGPGTWTDITSDVRSFDVSGGRQHELDRPQPTTLSATLDDRAGTYTPYNTGSPYSSTSLGSTWYGMVPGKPVRILATWAGTTYPIFYGFADSWEPKPKDALNQECELKASDILKMLSLAPILNTTLYPNTIFDYAPVSYFRCNDSIRSTAPADSSGFGTATFVEPNSLGFGGSDVSSAQSTSLLESGYTGGGSGAILYDPSTCLSISTPSDNASTTVTLASGFYATMTQITGNPNWSCSMLFQGQPGDCEGACLMGTVGFNDLDIGISYNTGGGGPVTNGYLCYTANGGTTQVSCGVLVNDGLWHSLIVLGEGVDTYIYLDGVQVASFAGTSSTQPNSQISFGVAALMAPSGVGISPTVNVQEIAVFNYALSAPDIAIFFETFHMLQDIEYTGDRINKVLTIIGYLGGTFSFPTDIATGTQLCQGESTSQTQVAALDYILNCADTELGYFYQGFDGTLNFRASTWITTNPTSDTSQATFADNASTSYHYFVDGLSILQDDLDLWTQVQVQAQQNDGAGVLQEATNTATTAAYGLRVLQRTGLLFAADSQAATQATNLLVRYQNPLPRVQSMTTGCEINGGAATPQMLGRAFWDQVTVGRQGPGEVAFSQALLIEGIAHSYQAEPGEFHTTWQLSPFELIA